MTRQEAVTLFRQHNKTPFLYQHALTLEQVLRWYADDLGYSKEKDYWGLVGLLHDIDFEEYPEQHCQVASDILRKAGLDECFIHSVTSHAYGICAGSPEPVHIMEKVLFAVDELTGLISAAALMRPSKSTADMELKSLKKKFKDKSFAAGCSRDFIIKGSDMLGWDLDILMEKTLDAMKSCENTIRRELSAN
jgi:predicted hydrolase (HD superfamily)